MQGVTSSTVAGLVAERGQCRSYQRGDTLFREGDRAVNIYVCRSGRIRIFVMLGTGHELVMGWKTPGDLFGELSALDQRPRAASATADEPSTVSFMRGDDFLDALHHEPELGVAVLRSLADELRRTNARLRARNAESTFARTGHRLIELSSLSLRHGDGLIELELTQDDIAHWIGATREATARALARYRAAGVVRTGRGRIIVDDLAGLVELVGSG